MIDKKTSKEDKHHAQADAVIREKVPPMIAAGVKEAKDYTDEKIKQVNSSINNSFNYDIYYLRKAGSGLVPRVTTAIPPALPKIGDYLAVTSKEVSIRGLVCEIRHFHKFIENKVTAVVWIFIDQSRRIDGDDVLPDGQVLQDM